MTRTVLVHRLDFLLNTQYDSWCSTCVQADRSSKIASAVDTSTDSDLAPGVPEIAVANHILKLDDRTNGQREGRRTYRGRLLDSRGRPKPTRWGLGRLASLTSRVRKFLLRHSGTRPYESSSAYCCFAQPDRTARLAISLYTDWSGRGPTAETAVAKHAPKLSGSA